MSPFQMCRDYGITSDVTFVSWPSGAVAPLTCHSMVDLAWLWPSFLILPPLHGRVLLPLSISAVDFSDYRCVVLWADDMAMSHLWGFWSLCPHKPCHEDSSSPTYNLPCLERQGFEWQTGAVVTMPTTPGDGGKAPACGPSVYLCLHSCCCDLN